MDSLYSLIVIASAIAVIASEAGSIPGGYLQYGALGLCGMMVLFLCRHHKCREESFEKEREKREAVHQSERETLVQTISDRDKNLHELSKQAIGSYNRLADMLEDRPCLMNDKRIKPDEPS